MMFDVKDLTDTRTAWICGVMYYHEKEFHVQLVLNLKLKQRLWDIWSKAVPTSHYFFQEVQIPFRIPEDVTPF